MGACAPRSLAAVLFREMDQEETGVLELDIIKELLSRLTDTSLRGRVEKLLHEHVFEEGNFEITRDEFISKWERAYLEQGKRRGTQSPSQKRYRPPHVFLKLNDLRPNSVLEPPPNPTPPPQPEKLDQGELLHIMRHRLQKLESLADSSRLAAPKFIGKGKSGSQKAVAEPAEPDLVEIRKRIQKLKRAQK